MTALGVNRFAGRELALATGPGDDASLLRHQVHFDPLELLIEESPVLPIGQLEIGPERLIGHQQRIAVEGPGYAKRIVVGRFKHRPGFDPVEANQQIGVPGPAAR